MPRTASEDRYWLPVDVKDETSIVSDAAFGIFDGTIWQAAILSTRMHRLWLETVGGRFKEDPRYSNTLVWNTFPLPSLSDRRKADLEEHWWAIDEARKEAGFIFDNGTESNLLMSSLVRRLYEDKDARRVGIMHPVHFSWVLVLAMCMSYDPCQKNMNSKGCSRSVPRQARSRTASHMLKHSRRFYSRPSQ